MPDDPRSTAEPKKDLEVLNGLLAHCDSGEACRIYPAQKSELFQELARRRQEAMVRCQQCKESGLESS